MLFAKYGDNILVAHERQSRITLIAHPPDRKAEPTAECLADMLAPLPIALRQTITFDLACPGEGRGNRVRPTSSPDRATRHPDLLLRPA